MEMKDSGKRQDFGENAAVRDSADGKPQMHLLSPWAWIHLPYGAEVGDYLLTHDIKFMHTAFLRMVNDYGWDRLCEWLRLGAEKYDEFNWAKGMPISRCIDSLGRHLAKLSKGLEDEDHAAAAMCNVMFIIHYHNAVDLGFLSSEFFDLFHHNRVGLGPTPEPPIQEPRSTEKVIHDILEYRHGCGAHVGPRPADFPNEDGAGEYTGRVPYFGS